MAKTKVTNITNGPKGAYLDGDLVMADPGEEIETDEEVNEEWFAKASSKAAKEATESQGDE